MIYLQLDRTQNNCYKISATRKRTVSNITEHHYIRVFDYFEPSKFTVLLLLVFVLVKKERFYYSVSEFQLVCFSSMFLCLYDALFSAKYLISSLVCDHQRFPFRIYKSKFNSEIRVVPHYSLQILKDT